VSTPSDSEVQRLVRDAARRIRALVSLVPDEPLEFTADVGVQDRVAFHLILSIQAALNLAAELARHHRADPSAGLGGLFESLASAAVIPWELVAPLQAGVRLRNRLLFDFDSVNANEVYDAARALPEALVDFVAHVAGTG
jgi:uncharacterized protein YutE (UPF0331/DUF86 family)